MAISNAEPYISIKYLNEYLGTNISEDDKEVLKILRRARYYTDFMTGNQNVLEMADYHWGKDKLLQAQAEIYSFITNNGDMSDVFLVGNISLGSFSVGATGSDGQYVNYPVRKIIGETAFQLIWSSGYLLNRV